MPAAAPPPGCGPGPGQGASSPATKKPLQLASNVEELIEQARVPKGASVNGLVKALPKLLKAATEAVRDGDEEKAFVFYMKYMEGFQSIRGSASYKKDPKYFEDMIGRKTVAEVVTASETLHGSLSLRYERKNHEEAMKKEEEEERKRKKKVSVGGAKRTVLAPGGQGTKKKGKEDRETDGGGAIDSRSLYSLLNQQATSLLLVDCRTSEDFSGCRFKSRHAVSVPEELIRPGITAKALERSLPVETRLEWRKRTTVDKLVLLDWFSGSFDEGTPLFHLREALVRWDVGESYACGQPAVLTGGFEDFLFRYPMMVTDSKRGRAAAKERRETSKSANAKQALPTLANVNYPKFNENGVLVVEEKKKALDPAIASGAITITRQQPPPPPAIPDRATKPVFPTPLDQARELPVEEVYDDDHSGDVSEDVSEEEGPPPVDRSTKAKYLLNQSRQSGVIGNMQEVQEAERELLEDSLEREQDELRLEDEWEKTRMRREKEAEEDMKLELLKKEESLMSLMEELRKESEEKEYENRRLKEELEELKAKMDKGEEDIALTKALLEKELEEKRVRAEVEEKRKARRAKEDELQRQLRQELEKNLEEKKRRERPVSPAVARVTRVPDRGAFSSGESSAPVPTPKFDRGAKPTPASQARARNFAPVYTLGQRKAGLTGLRNLGNTCYMNSVLQCMANFTVPAEYFMNHFERHLNPNSETRGEIAREFSEVLRALWGGKFQAVSPVDMKRAVGRYLPRFAGSTQQDAQEFFVKLMEWLHDDVNEVHSKVTLPEADFNKLSESDGAKEAWEFLAAAEKSFVVTTFRRLDASTLTCRACGWRSVKYDTNMELVLQLPADNSRYDVRRGIREMLSPEEVEYSCERCRRPRKCDKQLHLARLPPILVVHLKRFYEDHSLGVWRKKQNFVEFDNQFNAGEFVTWAGGRANYHCKYRLFAVCNHFGTMEGGHYTAYCYSQVYGAWHKYDDHEVTKMSSSGVTTSAAYILFYAAVN